MPKSREAALSALRESEERFRAVIAALEEGIVIHEADGSISSCNASACRILGLPQEQILGRTARNPGWRAIREDGSPFEPESQPATITLLTGESCSGVVMGVERQDVRHVLVRPHNHHAPALAVNAAHIEDVAAALQVRTEHLLVIAQAVAALLRQQE